ncbi:MAG: M15 family metallopeptidase, partial [Cryomorphaceae bacterium]
MFALLILSCSGCHSEATAQEGFVSLDTTLHQAVLKPMYFGTENFVGDTVDGYLARKILLSTEAASALSRVEGRLNKQGIGLKILDGYRPQKAVDHFIRWSKDPSDTIEKSRYYPEIRKDELFHKGYIAEQSGHTRGSAVDLTLTDLETGMELDMGSIVDYF